MPAAQFPGAVPVCLSEALGSSDQFESVLAASLTSFLWKCEILSMAWKLGAGLCFTNWARTRSDCRWNKSVNSSDRRLCCSSVQMAIDAGIVRHVGGRKSKQASTSTTSLHNLNYENFY